MITLDITDGLAVLTLNRPDRMNSLTAQMRAEIVDGVQAAAQQARVVVLTGAGRAFCTGQDLGDAGGADNIDLERILRDEYAPMLMAIHDCEIPTIAAVNGPAAGAGANLALATDVVIAAKSAYFLQAFTLIGLMPDAGGTWFLPRQIGLARAMGVALFADRIPAETAAEWGMIWESIADRDFEPHWRARARHLADGPTGAFLAVKMALRGSSDATLREQLAREAQLQGECGRSRDFREGVTAFMEKRAPRFEGR